MKSEKTFTVKLTAAQLALIYNGITFRRAHMKACEEWYNIAAPTINLQNLLSKGLYELDNAAAIEATEWRGNAPMKPKPTTIYND